MNEYTVHVHPAADAFPMMSEEEFQELVEDIKANGLRTPLVFNHNHSILIDGRNRLRACADARVSITYTTLPEGYTDQQIIDYIVSANVHRRHLTQAQKAMVATALEPMYAEAAKERMLAGKKDPSADLREGSPREGRADEQAAKAVGASGRAVSQAKALKRDAPDLADKVAAGTMTLNAADKERKARTAKPTPAPTQCEHVEPVAPAATAVTLDQVADGEVVVAYSSLPGTAKEKIKAVTRWIVKDCEAELEDIREAIEAEHAARIGADVQSFLEERIKNLEAREAKAEAIINAHKGKAPLTEKEYQLISNLMHQDTRLSATDGKLHRASLLFNTDQVRAVLVAEADHKTPPPKKPLPDYLPPSKYQVRRAEERKKRQEARAARRARFYNS